MGLGLPKPAKDDPPALPTCSIETVHPEPPPPADDMQELEELYRFAKAGSQSSV